MCDTALIKQLVFSARLSCRSRSADALCKENGNMSSSICLFMQQRTAAPEGGPWQRAQLVSHCGCGLRRVRGAFKTLPKLQPIMRVDGGAHGD